MDRRQTQTTFGGSSMQSYRIGTFELLLPTNSPQPGRSAPHETRGRALYRKAPSRFSKHYCNTAAGRENGHPKTHSRDNARNWLGGPTARPQHLQEPPGATQVSLLASGSRYLRTSAGLEYRYYIHSVARRVCLSYGSDRLVQSPCFSTPAFEQPGRHFLHRGVRGGNEKHGRPEIFNTDQGAQFSSREFVNAVLSKGIRFSMDGRGRALDKECVAYCTFGERLNSRVGGALFGLRPLTEPCVRVRTRLFMLILPISQSRTNVSLLRWKLLFVLLVL